MQPRWRSEQSASASSRASSTHPNDIGACLRQRRPPRGEVAVQTDRRCDRGPPLWRSTVTDQGNTPSGLGLKNQVSSVTRLLSCFPYLGKLGFYEVDMYR